MKTIFNPAYIDLVRRLKERRLELGLTQAQVAKRLGVNRSFVGKVEHRDRRLDVLEMLRLCVLYKLSLSGLLRTALNAKRR